MTKVGHRGLHQFAFTLFYLKACSLQSTVHFLQCSEMHLFREKYQVQRRCQTLARYIKRAPCEYLSRRTSSTLLQVAAAGMRDLDTALRIGFLF